MPENEAAGQAACLYLPDVTCIHCSARLDDSGARPAFDPWLGRLWRVCAACGRWNVVPLEDRWEVLESLERTVRDTGTSILRTPHLDLVRVRDGEVIRIGRAPRPELADWRYGAAVPPAKPSGLRARIRALFSGLPSSPHGYDTSELGILRYPADANRWLASPFIDDAPGLTALFGHLPLAPSCPGCGLPLMVAPWGFQGVRVLLSEGQPLVAATCARCRTEGAVPLAEVRPVLRLGLFMVNRRLRTSGLTGPAAGAIERADGPAGLIEALGRAGQSLGEAGPGRRLALQMALDEQAEAELLEAEWAEAEEIAAVVDGELTPGPETP